MRRYKVYDIKLDFDNDISIDNQYEIVTNIISTDWRCENYEMLRIDILAMYGYQINYILWDELNDDGIPIPLINQPQYRVEDDGSVIEV